MEVDELRLAMTNVFVASVNGHVLDGPRRLLANGFSPCSGRCRVVRSHHSGASSTRSVST